MTGQALESDAAELRQKALSRWDNEGGALQHGSTLAAIAEQPRMSDAELVQLHIRTIALENVIIALLAGASEQDNVRVREAADTILPRPGYTQHPLTIAAAAQMNHLVDRAAHFRPGAKVAPGLSDEHMIGQAAEK